VLDDRSPTDPAPKTPRRYLPEGYDTSKWPDDPTQGHKNPVAQPSLLGKVVGSLFILLGSFMVVADLIALASGRIYVYARGGGWWSSSTQDDPWWWFLWLLYLGLGVFLVVEGARNFRPRKIRYRA
jgi:hypothetical protein